MNYFIGVLVFPWWWVISRVNSNGDWLKEIYGIYASDILEIHKFVFLDEKINTLGESLFTFSVVITL